MRNTGWIATVAALGFITSAAFAGLAPDGWIAGPNFGEVAQSTNPGELTFIEILEGTYVGETFTGDNGKAFGDTVYRNADDSIVLTRIEDFGDTSLKFDLFGGTPGSPSSAPDQLWQDGIVNVEAHARYASLNQSFGYYDGVDTNSYTELFKVQNTGLNVTGEAQNVSLGTQFGWVRNVGDPPIFNDGGPHYSVDAHNKDGLNHMLAYQVSIAGSATPHYWLWFEDVNLEDPANPSEDWDFNDLVVEVRVIPAPAAVLLGLLGLGMTGWIKRRGA